MSSNAQYIYPKDTGIVLAPGASSYVYVNMEDFKYFRAGLEVAYATTSSSTGVSCSIYSGIGPLPAAANNPGLFAYITTSPASLTDLELPFIGDNSTNAVTLVTVTPSSASAQRRRTIFYLDAPIMRLGGIVLFVLVNNDPSVSATVGFYADVA